MPDARAVAEATEPEMTNVDAPFMRPVHLPAGVAGRLWLGPMPGRLRPLAEDLAALAEQRVERIICLTPGDEIARKSPDYAARQGGLGILVTSFPIGDFGVPADEAGLGAVAAEAASDLRAGRALYIHCAAGIGRSGTVGICILLALGLDVEEATSVIAAAGSGPETDDQKQLVMRLAAAASGSSAGKA